MKDELVAKLQELREKSVQALPSFQNLKELQDFKIQFLGRKGLLTEVLKGLGRLKAEERPVVGSLANRLKKELEEKISELQSALEAKAFEQRAKDSLPDVTLPGLALGRGHKHPLRLVSQQIESIFLKIGFSIAEGPDVETDYYNFGALNFPPDHPAREMQDTFYIGGMVGHHPPAPPSHAQSKSDACSPIYIGGMVGHHPPAPPSLARNKSDARSPYNMDMVGHHPPALLLRTHTSPVQIRAMEKTKPPLYLIAPGAVYRHDDDVTHSPMFHQVEGLAVDTHITFGDLKGVLTLFCRTFFGEDRKLRFRPSFFPFVEPGAEVDISCRLCDGKGCRVCGGDGWLEILGAGMVHPAVLKNVKIDPKKYSGFAFGMGVERIAMLKYGIDDIRLFYESDLRFLEQF